MELCYDGAMVMPSSYAVMDTDKMTYVIGGWNIKLNQLEDGVYRRVLMLF